MTENLETTANTTRAFEGDVRASDAERERTATIIRRAAEEGRLTLDELDERLELVYAARTRRELPGLVADLPEPPPEAGSPAGRRPGPSRAGRVALAAHAALVVALMVVVLTRWVAGGMVFFWPVFPIFWALFSLAVHARWRGIGPRWWDSRDKRTSSA